MQLNLGTKIKELRRRDGRTQENLADALGVTAQAVSRWESGTTYPDMQMIPAIANYFHISIDELFGYHDDREEKIKKILETATEIMTRQGHSMYQGCLPKDFLEVVNMLRDAADEFPNEPRILLKLARALWMWGWSEYGAKGKANDASEPLEEDTEYSSKNIYWQEAIRTYERILKSNPSAEDREATIYQLTSLSCDMGEYNRAKTLANEQNSITICKEILLPLATSGEERARYQGECLTVLLRNLDFVIANSIALRPSVQASGYACQLLLSLANLYETVFIDGRFGEQHKYMGGLYLLLASYELKHDGSLDTALHYFDTAFDHYKESIRIQNEENYNYSAPLVSGLKTIEKSALVPSYVDMANFLKDRFIMFPQNFVDELRKNPKYAECFE